jgi:hypothetical protein
VSRFFDAGYADGQAHGRIHGLIEGRALGREKGFEIGEELGFYEGVARVWETAYVREGKADQYVMRALRSSRFLIGLCVMTSRATHHARQLLALLATFPLKNSHEEDGIDLSALLRQARSRYKALCASVGMRPSLRAALSDSVEDTIEGDAEISTEPDSRKTRSVWKVEGAPTTEQGLSF